MRMISAVLALLLSSVAIASPPSIIGGKTMGTGTAQVVSLGWPSLMYEYYKGGDLNWGIAGELVYGDWAGAYSDVRIGAAVSVPMRFKLAHSGIWSAAFKVSPGALVGTFGNEIFVGAFRGDLALQISADMGRSLNLVTGAAAPVTLLLAEGVDPLFVLPVMARIGVEFMQARPYMFLFLLELGPAFATGAFNDADFAFRAWVGAAFW